MSPESPSPHPLEPQGSQSQQAVSLTAPCKCIKRRSPAERWCVHGVPFVGDKRSPGCTVPAPQSCLPLLVAPWGDRSPPGADLLGQTEVRAGTALRSASQQGKWQAVRHAPVLLLALCPQPWNAGAAVAMVPWQPLSLFHQDLGISPAAVSCCPF